MFMGTVVQIIGAIVLGKLNPSNFIKQPMINAACSFHHPSMVSTGCRRPTSRIPLGWPILSLECA